MKRTQRSGSWVTASVTPSSSPLSRPHPAQELAHLLALTCRDDRDVSLLLPSVLLASLLLRPCPQEVADGHAEAVGGEVGDPEDQHHTGREAGAGDAGHHGERRHDAVDGSVDEVPQRAASRASGEADTDGVRRVLVLDTGGRRREASDEHDGPPRQRWT
jgi:hypothetical protein